MHYLKKSSAHSTDFSQGSIPRTIMNLAIPMTLAQMIDLLYNIVDRMYVGRIGGQGHNLAMSGLGICLSFIFIVLAFTNLVGVGGATVFSMKRGERNKKAAQEVLNVSVGLLFLFSFVIIVAGFIFAEPMIRAMGASEKSLPYALKYFRVYLFGTFFIVGATGLNTFINAQGFAKTGLMTVAIGAVLNIILDPIFIFTFNLGISGAALATVISQFLSFLWTIYFLTGPRSEYKITLKNIHIKSKYLKEILLIGFPSFTFAFTNGAVQTVCNNSLQRYGEGMGDFYVGIMTIALSLQSFLRLPASGLTRGSQPVLSFNYGDGKFKRVRQAIRFISILSLIYLLVMWGILAAFPQFFIRIFTSDARTVQEGVRLLQLYFVGFCFMAGQFVGQSVFTATGQAKKAVFFSLFRKIILVIPLIYLFSGPMNLGVEGVFLAEPVSNVVSGILCYFTMYKTTYCPLGRREGE